MARKRYKPEKFVSLLWQAEVLHGQGMSMADAIRQPGISEVTRPRIQSRTPPNAPVMLSRSNIPPTSC